MLPNKNDSQLKGSTFCDWHGKDTVFFMLDGYVGASHQKCIERSTVSQMLYFNKRFSIY